MLNTTININNSRINSWLVIFIVFFFPIIALANYTFDIRTGILSQTYRLFNFAISLLIIGQFTVNAINAKKLLVHPSFLLLILFWIIYLLRLVVDIEIFRLHQITSYSKSYYYLFALCITFTPMLALSFLKPIDFTYLIKDLKIILIFFNLSIFVLFLQELSGNEFIFRFYLRRADIEFLNPITIGVYASILILICHLVKEKKSTDYLFLLIGTINLFAVASRGPILFAAVVILIASAFNLNLFFKNITDLLLKLGLIVLTFCFILFIFDLPILNRIANLTSDDSSTIRKSILNETLLQITSNPMFGSHFIVVNSKSYSHNLVLDILLSNGFLGILITLPIFVVFIIILFKNRFKSSFLLIVLFLFLCSNTSGAIYNSYEFWLTFALVLTNQNQFINFTTNSLYSNE